MKTVNNIFDLFKVIATSHKQINSFVYGDIGELDTYDNIIYPVLIVSPITSEVNEYTINHTYRLAVADLVNKDEVNQVEVWSDTQQILTDIAKIFRYDDVSFYLLNQPILTPFKDKWDDDVSGWQGDYEIEFDYDSSECNVPIDAFLIPGPTSSGAVPSCITLLSLCDVNVDSPTNGQVLVYRDGEWVNQDQSGGSFDCDDLLRCEVFAGLVSDVYQLTLNLDNYALLSGAKFTGDISATNLSGTNTGDQDLSDYATTSALGNYLPLAGGTMSGSIDLDDYDIQNVNQINTSAIVLNTLSFPTSISSINDNVNNIVIDGTGNINFEGLVYQSDYSTNYTNRSLVDKEYVDTLVGAYLPLAGGTMDNGVNPVIIDFAMNPLTTQRIYFGDDESLQFDARVNDDNNFSNISLNTGGNFNLSSYINDGNVWINSIGTDTTGEGIVLNSAIDADFTAIKIYPGGVLIQSTYASFNGLVYNADYSANFTPESLVTKRYVDTTVLPLQQGSLSFAIDGNGADIIIGASALLSSIISAGTITNWYVEGEEASGSIVIDVQKWNGSSYVSIIGAGNKPTITTSKFATATVASWTSTTLTKNDRIRFVVDSISGFTKVNLQVFYTKN